MGIHTLPVNNTECISTSNTRKRDQLAALTLHAMLMEQEWWFGALPLPAAPAEVRTSGNPKRHNSLYGNLPLCMV